MNAILREELERSILYFRLAERRTARKQAASLIRAKAWLSAKGLSAVEIGSKFDYVRSTGAVLREGRA